MPAFENPTFYPYRMAAWMRISGADAATYLQGQFTNDVRNAAAGREVYGLWLNQKGKVLADSFLLKGNAPDEFFLASYFSPAEVIRERLEAYVIADDVTIEDATQDVEGISFIEEAGGSFTLNPPPGTFSFTGRRTTHRNVEWIFSKEHKSEIFSKLSLSDRRELSPASVEYRRIAAGIPAVPQDVGPSELPNEGGLDATAISYTKGCYLGQEVMARLKAMGKVRRRLFRVEIEGATIPALPAVVYAGDRKVGELRSAAVDASGNFIGLALLSVLYLQPGTSLSLARDGSSPLRVSETP